MSDGPPLQEYAPQLELFKISGEWPTKDNDVHDETLLNTIWFNKHTGKEATIIKVYRLKGAKNPIVTLQMKDPVVLSSGETFGPENWNADFLINHWYPHPLTPDDEDVSDAEFYLRIIGGSMIKSYLEDWRTWRDEQNE